MLQRLAQARVLSLGQLKTGRDLGRFAQHDAGRAELFVAHGYGPLYRTGGDVFAGDAEVHVDFYEHLGVDLGPLGRELDAAALHGVAAALQDQHHVVGAAAAGTGQHGFHGPGRQVLAAVFGFGSVGRAVHHQHMAAAGLGHKAHTGAGAAVTSPTDGAFHTNSPKASGVKAARGKAEDYHPPCTFETA